MHRRRFLATLGATAVAGCTAQTTPTNEPQTTAPPTEVSTTAETTTTARTTEPPTTQAESTPTRGEVLAKRGREHIQAAIAAFVEAAEGPDPTIVDVSAASSEFSRFDVDEAYRDAMEDLNDAKGLAEGALADEVDDLIAVAEFVNTLGFAQIQLVNSFDRVEVAMRTLYTESYDGFDDDVGEIESHRRLADEHAASIHETYDGSIFSVVDGITAEQFEDKMDQIDRELATFDGLVTHLDGLSGPMEDFEDDVGKYTTRQYEGVSFASGDFEDARDGLSSIEPAESLRPIVEELACVFDALAAGSIEMQKAALAQRNDDSSTAGTYESDAEAEFQSCETLVEEVEPVEKLVDSF